MRNWFRKYFSGFCLNENDIKKREKKKPKKLFELKIKMIQFICEMMLFEQAIHRKMNVDKAKKCKKKKKKEQKNRAIERRLIQRCVSCSRDKNRHDIKKKWFCK